MSYYKVTLDNGWGQTFDVWITANFLYQVSRTVIVADGVKIDFGLVIEEIL